MSSSVSVAFIGGGAAPLDSSIPLIPLFNQQQQQNSDNLLLGRSPRAISSNIFGSYSNSHTLSSDQLMQVCENVRKLRGTRKSRRRNGSRRRGRRPRPMNLPESIHGTSRLGKLYCRTGYQLEVHDKRINGTHKDNSRFGILEFMSITFGLVSIRGKATGNYVCMNGIGKLYASRRFSDECIFMEKMLENFYNTYSSCAYSTSRNNGHWHIAINRRGRPRKGSKSRRKKKYAQFLVFHLRPETTLESIEHNSFSQSNRQPDYSFPWLNRTSYRRPFSKSYPVKGAGTVRNNNPRGRLRKRIRNFGGQSRSRNNFALHNQKVEGSPASSDLGNNSQIVPTPSYPKHQWLNDGSHRYNSDPLGPSSTVRRWQAFYRSKLRNKSHKISPFLALLRQQKKSSTSRIILPSVTRQLVAKVHREHGPQNRKDPGNAIPTSRGSSSVHQSNNNLKALSSTLLTPGIDSRGASVPSRLTKPISSDHKNDHAKLIEATAALTRLHQTARKMEQRREARRRAMKAHDGSYIDKANSISSQDDRPAQLEALTRQRQYELSRRKSVDEALNLRDRNDHSNHHADSSKRSHSSQKSTSTSNDQLNEDNYSSGKSGEKKRRRCFRRATGKMRKWCRQLSAEQRLRLGIILPPGANKFKSSRRRIKTKLKEDDSHVTASSKSSTFHEVENGNARRKTYNISHQRNVRNFHSSIGRMFSFLSATGG